jgi:hypothetical protein
MASSIFRARMTAASFAFVLLTLVATTSTVAAAAPPSKTNKDASVASDSSRKSSAGSRTSKRTGRAIEECCAAGEGDDGGAADKNATVDDDGNKFVYLDDRICNVTCVSALVSDAYANRTLFVGGGGARLRFSSSSYPKLMTRSESLITLTQRPKRYE